MLFCPVPPTRLPLTGSAFHRSVLPTALLLFGLLRSAHAQVCFPGNAVINSAVHHGVIVGYATPGDRDYARKPTSPTVTLVNGGSVGGKLDVTNRSRVTVKGGSVTGTLSAWGSSTVSIMGGSLDSDLDTFKSSAVTVSGGSIAGDVHITDGSTLNLRGGKIAGDLYAIDGALNLYGTGLSKTLVDAKAFQGDYSKYTLSGTLRDGSSVSGKTLLVYNKYHARINFINAIVSQSKQSAPARQSVSRPQ